MARLLRRHRHPAGDGRAAAVPRAASSSSARSRARCPRRARRPSSCHPARARAELPDGHRLRVVWPGIDGYENPFGIDFAAMRDRFADGLAEAMDCGARRAGRVRAQAVRAARAASSSARRRRGCCSAHMVEARLQNPENRQLLVEGHALVGLNPEVGHALMAYEDLPYAYSWPLSEGRLAHMHLNSQPLGNFDQDLNVGVISPEQTEALLYVLKMHGYHGWFGIDINPERMPVDMALRISMDALRAANDRINDLDHESILYAVNHPDKARGWLEGYLVRMRAMHPRAAAPLPPLK